MSLRERTGLRDLLYSGWHRPDRIRRFVPYRVAATLKVCDIDWCEACHWCSWPVALIETQESSRGPKAAVITQNLARLAGIPAYSVSYVRGSDNDDIESFGVRQIAPANPWVQYMTPTEYAGFLVGLRDNHYAESEVCAAKAKGVA